MLRVVGLFEEIFVNNDCVGSNCEYEYPEMMDTKYHVFVRNERDDLFDITLYNSFNECPSGWCPASYGNCEVQRLTKPHPFTHTPVREIIIDGLTIDFDDDDLNLVPVEKAKRGNNYIAGIDRYGEVVFEVDFTGGDDYYPNGSVSVNEKLFKKAYRAEDLKRCVYIFEGSSGLGKSTLAFHLPDVYETDSSESLPSTIYENVIVLGNKYDFTFEEVVDRIFHKDDCKIIRVSFSQFEG